MVKSVVNSHVNNAVRPTGSMRSRDSKRMTDGPVLVNEGGLSADAGRARPN